MRPRKPEAVKKKPGPPPRRPFNHRVGFHISDELHQQMKGLAKVRKIFLEDIYEKALSNFLELRASESTSYQYVKPPSRPMARHVTIQMQEALWQAIRHAVVDDRARIGEVFETAVRLYLTKQHQHVELD